MNEEIYLICGPATHFPDDRVGVCSDCQSKVGFKPHSPAEAIKICLTCAHIRFQRGETPSHVMITGRVREELWQFMKKEHS